MKKGINLKMEIYQSREVKNQKGEHMNIIFEFEKPAAISETGTVPVNTVTVIINEENRLTCIDKGDRVFDCFLKLYANDDVKFRDISQLLIFEMFKPDIIKNVCSMNVKGYDIK